MRAFDARSNNIWTPSRKSVDQENEILTSYGPFKKVNAEEVE